MAWSASGGEPPKPYKANWSTSEIECSRMDSKHGHLLCDLLKRSNRESGPGWIRTAVGIPGSSTTNKGNPQYSKGIAAESAVYL